MKRAKHILIGLKTLDHAVELTNLACRVGARNASLRLVHIIELPDPTPLDADVPDLDATAEAIIRAAKRVASRCGMKVSTLVLRARHAGLALLDEMKGKDIDLAVIGHQHRQALVEVLLGSTAKYLAIHAPCHLLIDIPPRAL
jgi:nucleotide-binding universal stress UspA family protein